MMFDYPVTLTPDDSLIRSNCDHVAILENGRLRVIKWIISFQQE